MTLLTPLGLLGLLGVVALIIIYLIRPNYQQKFVSTTFVWKLSLKYRKKKIPVSKLRNLLLILCQILILASAAAILTTPAKILKQQKTDAEVIIILDSSANMRTQSSEGETRFERAVNGALDLSEKTLNSNGAVSVILADSQPYYLAQGATLETQEDLYDNLQSLLDVEGMACSYGSSDMKRAIELTNDLLAENPNAEVYLYSGTTYLSVPKGINIVDVSKKDEEWNAAILNAYTLIENNTYSFVVEVACYGADMDIEVTVEVNGANAKDSSDVTGSNIVYTEYATCIGGETHTVIFTAEGIGDLADNVTYYPIGVEEKVFTYQSIHVSIDEDDSFELDNSFDIYDGQKELFKVQYYSERSNGFFNMALATLRNRLSRRFDMQVVEVKNREPELSGFNLYIFEHEMPAQMPTDGIVILANPDVAPVGSGLTISGSYDFPNLHPESLMEEQPHPLLNYIVADSIAVSQIVRISNANGYETLLTCNRYPVLLVKNAEQQKVMVMAFSVHFADITVRPEFVTLLYNMFNYFVPATVSGNAFEVNESVNLTSRGGPLTIVGNGTEQEITELPGTMKLSIPGAYEIVQDDDFGTTLTERIFVKIPAIESNIKREADALDALEKEIDLSSYFEELLVYVAAAMVALLFIEWWLQSRESM